MNGGHLLGQVHTCILLIVGYGKRIGKWMYGRFSVGETTTLLVSVRFSGQELFVAMFISVVTDRYTRSGH